MDNIRIILVNLVSAVMAFLSPIKDFMTAVVILFGVNFLCGLIADNIHGDGWQTRKAMRFMSHCFLYFGLITFIYTCGHFMHNRSGAVQCVSYICYVAFYIYTANILRNLISVMHPDTNMHKLFSFLYWVLSFKFVEKVPYLREWKTVKEREREMQMKQYNE